MRVLTSCFKHLRRLGFVCCSPALLSCLVPSAAVLSLSPSVSFFDKLPVSRMPMAKNATKGRAGDDNHSCDVAGGSGFVRIFMVGDVMLGRGIDQILEHHCDPVLYEGYVKDAREYVELAVRANGPLPAHREVDYIWGDAIGILDEMRPDVRVINLETAVTTSPTPWPQKGIHYRMHPKNVDAIKAAKIDCAILSNNHTLDWSYPGLTESLQTLNRAGIRTVGAGEDLAEAQSPAIFEAGLHLGELDLSVVRNSRPQILVFGLGHASSGIPYTWRAGGRNNSSGVNLVEFDSPRDFKAIKKSIADVRKPGDVVLVSIHWGANWDWELESGQKEFAHKLIDEAHVDVIHGHSSHHIKGAEVYKGKLIAWGCGDFLSDYEGIGGIGGPGWHGEFRDSLSFMYFVDVDPASGSLVNLTLVPMHLRQLQVTRATGRDKDWLYDNMKRECRKWGCDLETKGDHFSLVLP